MTGFACNHPETDYLPPAHFIANYIGRKVDGWRRTVSDKFGPDFKVLVHIEDNGGRYEWRRLTISIQHREGVFAAEQHELVLPVVSGALAELEARGLAGISDLPLEDFVLNGMGDFIVGGPEGDNGLSGYIINVGMRLGQTYGILALAAAELQNYGVAVAEKLMPMSFQRKSLLLDALK